MKDFLSYLPKGSSSDPPTKGDTAYCHLVLRLNNEWEYFSTTPRASRMYASRRVKVDCCAKHTPDAPTEVACRIGVFIKVGEGWALVQEFQNTELGVSEARALCETLRISVCEAVDQYFEKQMIDTIGGGK